MARLPNGNTTLAGGGTHTCVLTGSGGVKCWGSNSNGQIGDNSVPWRLFPVSLVNWFHPILAINYNTGQPSSYFAFAGSDYPPDAAATIAVNSITYTRTVPVDSAGNLNFQMHTVQADEGYYIVTAGAEDVATGARFTMSADAPLQPQEGTGYIFDVPAGIAYTQLYYFPTIYK
jgi:hypothetical protein